MEWISVDDRLPDEDVTVSVGEVGKELVTEAHCKKYHFGIGWWRDTGTGTSSISINPTHWMPLPKPPKY